MRALAGKKAAVVPIETARQRLRPQIRSSNPPDSPHPGLGTILVALVGLTVLYALAIGWELAFGHHLMGSDRIVLVAPLAVVLVAVASLSALIVIRRRRHCDSEPPHRGVVIPRGGRSGHRSSR